MAVAVAVEQERECVCVVKLTLHWPQATVHSSLVALP